MLLKFKAEEIEDSNIIIKSLYSKKDFALVVNLQHTNNSPILSKAIEKLIAINPRSSFVIFENLTLEFSSVNSTFKSLDAYTNYEKWTLAPVVIPSVEMKKCTLTVNGNLNEDRISIEKSATYQFDDKHRCLLIKLEEVKKELFYQLNDDFIFGLSDGNLTSFYLSNLQIQE